MAANFSHQTIWTGDNLDIMRGMNSECVDLIYLDPPFNSNRNYAAPIGSEAAGSAFKDTWTLSDVDEAWHGEIADREPAIYAIIDAARQSHGKAMKSYLIMMAVRLLEMRRVLKDTGCMYLHCDPTASHYLKLLMDAVFGAGNFRNEISWKRSNPKSLHSVNFPNNRDIILRYSKADKTTFHKVFVAHDQAYVDKAYKYTEEDGRRYRLLPLLNPSNDRPNLTYEFLGVTRVWRWTRDRMQKAYDEGIVMQLKPGAVPQYKYYLEDSKGRTATDDWNDIAQTAGGERVGYPTQKPLALLDRIIKASTNEEPYDPERPVVCFDETSKQLLAEKRSPIPPKPARRERYDYEYQRNGTRNLFMLCEPLAGWRHVAVTERRTMVDFAQQMRWLADEAYPASEKIRVVLDNLNTHKPASLYETFEPKEARRIRKRLEFHYTPKHGSWLNMAEIEFSVLARRVLRRRIADEETLSGEIAALEAERNQAGATIDWRFSTVDARRRGARPLLWLRYGLHCR